MPDTRIYLPLTPAQVIHLHRHRRLSAPLKGVAVTEAVRRAEPGGDEESWEYAAMQQAAAAAAAQGAVIVAAADVAPALLKEEGADGAVLLSAGVELRRVASFHLGDDVVSGASPAVGTEPVELSWYDTTELEQLVSLVEGATSGQ